MKKTAKILLILLTAAALLFAGGYRYVHQYYPAQQVQTAMATDSTVQVSEIPQGYFFDGPGETDALIFYPGAKIDETAYAPLMRRLAENGVDGYLIRMPLHFAFLGLNRADSIISAGDYKRYFLAGHSLGGAMAAEYAAGHGDALSGLFLLAAYPVKDLTNADYPVVFLYGDCDNVVNREKIKEGIALSPPDSAEIVIEGGNHAGFGSYGAQKGDGDALITPDAQQSFTADVILGTVRAQSAK